MRVLHVVYGWHPDPVGGTETYVAELARQLQRLGWDSVIAAPGTANTSYPWEGLPVMRFAGSPQPTLSQQYGMGDPVAARNFEACLQAAQPDIIHFHALTAAASALAVQAGRRRGLPVVFTYHTPTVSCPRGTMMRWGREPCDGAMRPRVCSACTAHGQGLPKPAALALAAVPWRLLRTAAQIVPPGRAATALRLPGLVRAKFAATRAAWSESSRVVAVCDWVCQVIARNGPDSARVVVCRQGAPASRPAMMGLPPMPTAFTPDRPMRLGYFGRLDATKGVEVLIAALRALPGAPLQLTLHAPPAADDGYSRIVSAGVQADPRICVAAGLPHSAVPAAMAACDLVVVPSVCLETGPLVVYEAFAAGVPVIGSRLGGIAELVRDGVDGLLLAPGSSAEWAAALAALLREPARIDAWRAAIRPPRTMAQVADEMSAVYADCLKRNPQGEVPHAAPA